MVTSSYILPLEQPRVSSNQLGLFPFLSPVEKRRMLHDHKFGNKITAPYYQPAECAVLRSFSEGHYDTKILRDAIDELAVRPAKNVQQRAKWDNNAEMLRRFLSITTGAEPPTGDHRVVRRNARFNLSGVVVSVRPEIVTQEHSADLFAYTKFRFSKHKVSADASEIILLVLLNYGQQRSGELQIDPEKTKLIDVHAKNVVHGHKIPRFREQQLRHALEEICRLWPTVRRLPDSLQGLSYGQWT